MSLVATAAALADRTATAGVLPGSCRRPCSWWSGSARSPGCCATGSWSKAPPQWSRSLPARPPGRSGFDRLDQPAQWSRQARPPGSGLDRLDHPAGPPGRALHRRAFLGAAAAVGVAASAGGVAARALGGSVAAAARRPGDPPGPQCRPGGAGGVDLGVDGVTPYLTTNADFYRVDTALRVPRRARRAGGRCASTAWSTGSWSCRSTTCSAGGWSSGGSPSPACPTRSAARTPATPLARRAPRRAARRGRGPPSADQVRSTSLRRLHGRHAARGRCRTVEQRALSPSAMNGEPLPLTHGFPARMVVPGLYGYVSATKWLVDLEVTRFADFKAYWTTRGYSARAPYQDVLADRRAEVSRGSRRRASWSPASPGRRPSASARSRCASTRGDVAGGRARRRGQRQHLAAVGLPLGRSTGSDPSAEVRATDRDGHADRRARSHRARRATGWHASTSSSMRRLILPSRPTGRALRDPMTQGRSPLLDEGKHHLMRTIKNPPRPLAVISASRTAACGDDEPSAATRERGVLQRHRRVRAAMGEGATTPWRPTRPRTSSAPAARRYAEQVPDGAGRSREWPGPRRRRGVEQPAAHDADRRGVRPAEPRGQPGRHAQRRRVHVFAPVDDAFAKIDPATIER